MTTKAPVKNHSTPLIIFFILSTALLLTGRAWLKRLNVDTSMVIVGNMILFGVTLASLLLYQKAMLHPGTMGFLRNTYSGLFLKLLVCAAAAVIYIFIQKEHTSKAGIFACLFLYVIYSALEIRCLLQWNKARNNA